MKMKHKSPGKCVGGNIYAVVLDSCYNIDSWLNCNYFLLFFKNYSKLNLNTNFSDPG